MHCGISKKYIESRGNLLWEVVRNDLPLHVLRHAAEELKDAKPSSWPTHSPGTSHCRAVAPPKRRKSSIVFVSMISFRK